MSQFLDTEAQVDDTSEDLSEEEGKIYVIGSTVIL